MKGHVIAVDGEITIGRNPENVLQIDDMQVSRRHAKVERTPDGCVLKDLGSGNGTFIGSRRILEHALADGEVIRIGGQHVQFRAARMAAPAVDNDSKLQVFQSDGGEEFEARDAKNIYHTFFQPPEIITGDERLREMQKRLTAVYAANQAIASEQNISGVFDRIMDQVFSLLPADTGVILLKGDDGQEPRVEYVRSKSGSESVHVSTTIVLRAYERGEAVITCNAMDDSRFNAGLSIIAQNISSAMCAPLTHQDDRLGVIYVDNHGMTDAFKNSDLELLVALAGPAATAIKNAKYVRMVEQSYQDTLLVLANAIELRDHYTVGHTWRVTNFAVEIARELGWDEAKLREVQMGGVLHDVGKIAVDNTILGKPEQLSDEEFAQMKVHPERGADLLRGVKFLQPVIPYCLYHHERWDGDGYPFGLKGSEIPVEGRLVAVADTFDAMTSNRPYRKGLDPLKAIETLVEGKGSQFDPKIVDALVACYHKGKIEEVLQNYHRNEARSIACPFCSTFIRLNAEVRAESEITCPVCHRRIVVVEHEGYFYGELVVPSRPHSVPPSSSGA
jgi:putative nucleotidyltransferase with HDIG domain